MAAAKRGTSRLAANFSDDVQEVGWSIRQNSCIAGSGSLTASATTTTATAAIPIVVATFGNNTI
jgi:hypothetical protein